MLYEDCSVMRKRRINDRQLYDALRRFRDFDIFSALASVRDLFKSAILWVKRKLGMAPPEERNVLQKIGDGLKSIWKKIGIVEKIKGTKARISVIWDILGIIAKVKAFFGKVASIPSMIGDVLKAAVSKIGQVLAMTKASSKPLDSANQLLLARRKMHGDLDIKGAFSKLKEKFTAGKNKIVSLVKSLISKAKSVIEKIKDKIKAAKDAKDRAKAKIYEKIRQAMVKLLAKAIEALFFIAEGLNEGYLKEKSIKKLKSIASDLREKATSAKDKFVAVFASALSKIADKIKAMFAKIKSLPNKAVAK